MVSLRDRGCISFEGMEKVVCLCFFFSQLIDMFFCIVLLHFFLFNV
jgi:hypothetical protein